MWNWYTNNNPVRKLKNKVEEQKMKTKNKSFKRLFAFLVALVMVTALVPSVIFAADPTFPDVPTTHWAYDYIEKLAKAEIIGGYADGTFGPEDNVTRQQAAKMIAGAADLEAGINFTSKFTDLDKVAAELKPFVLALEENKVAGGFADGSFGPTLNIKRSQAAKMIVKAFGIVKGGTAVSFADPVADATDQSYIDILASNGIVKGYTEDGKQLFKPYNLVTRAQLAKMIVEAMDWEPEVLTVKAMDQMVVKNKANTELKFLVNGQEFTYSSFDDAYGHLGYGLKFSYSVAGFSADKGIGTPSVDFSYAVQVIDDDLNMIPASVSSTDYADVKVVDEDKVIKITDLGLYPDGDTTKDKLDFVTLTTSDKVAVIKATKGLNGLDKELKTGFPNIESVTSSNISIAYYDVSGSKLMPVSVGKVTLTVKFVGITEKYSLAVEVKAAREITSLKNENVKIEAGASSSESYALGLAYLDQYGDDITGTPASLRVVVKNAAGAEQTDQGSFVYDLATKGVYTVTVSHIKAPATTYSRLGSFTVEAVDISEANTTYKLVFNNPEVTEVDANELLDPPEATLTLKIEADKLGVAQASPSLPLTATAFKVVSSNPLVATVSDSLVVTAKSAGTVTITLYTVASELETPVATINVVVKNTTPQITSLKLKTGTKLTGSYTAEGVAPQLESVDLDGKAFTAAMIDTLVYSSQDKTVVLTLEALYGGRTFTYATTD
jgi:hypothetical protein